MIQTPFNSRPYQVFLSHSARDKNDFVDGLFEWLNDKAGIRTWYDRAMGSGGIASQLDHAIDSSQAAVIVISKNSVDSPWVRAEYDRLAEEKARHRDFRIVTIRLDNTEAPGLLKGSKHIDAIGGEWTPDAAAMLIDSLFGGGDSSAGQPLYLCRGWKSENASLGVQISNKLRSKGFRPVCDWPDHAKFDEHRVARLVSGCVAVVAILPNRGGGATSKYILKELEIAHALRITTLAFLEPGVKPDRGWNFPYWSVDAEYNPEWESQVMDKFEELSLNTMQPIDGLHVFIGHSHSVEGKYRKFSRMISRVAGLPIVVGRMVDGLDVPQSIVRDISRAEFCLFDITNKEYQNLPAKIDFALNTCIEAGIAIGAKKTLYLMCSGQERSPPFMFRSAQVRYYREDLDLVAHLYKSSAQHRRLVI